MRLERAQSIADLRRMARRPSRFAALTTPLARVVRGRPDAPPLVRRAVLSTACTFGLRLAPWESALDIVLSAIAAQPSQA